jgi:hypothetical protein
VVRHDARVPMEPHHPDRQRRPRGAGRAEKTGDPTGGEGNKGETLGLAGPPVCVCVCVCVCVDSLFNSQRSSMYITVFLSVV